MKGSEEAGITRPWRDRLDEARIPNPWRRTDSKIRVGTCRAVQPLCRATPHTDEHQEKGRHHFWPYPTHQKSPGFRRLRYPAACWISAADPRALSESREQEKHTRHAATLRSDAQHQTARCGYRALPVIAHARLLACSTARLLASSVW